MKTTYYDEEDTLVIRLSEKPIVREVSQDWNTHVSYAADGTVVETVILEAARVGAWPMQIEQRVAARWRPAKPAAKPGSGEAGVRSLPSLPPPGGQRGELAIGLRRLAFDDDEVAALQCDRHVVADSGAHRHGLVAGHREGGQAGDVECGRARGHPHPRRSCVARWVITTRQDGAAVKVSA